MSASSRGHTLRSVFPDVVEPGNAPPHFRATGKHPHTQRWEGVRPLRKELPGDTQDTVRKCLLLKTKEEKEKENVSQQLGRRGSPSPPHLSLSLFYSYLGRRDAPFSFLSDALHISGG